MRYTVRTPVEGYSGEVAHVVFQNGVGVCSPDDDVTYFQRHGYVVEELAEEPAPETAPVEDTDAGGKTGKKS